MNRKILTLLTAASFALFFGACGDDSSSNSAAPSISCEDNDDCLDNDDEIESSSSKKGDAKSSSSVKEDKDGKSSSSSAKDEDDDDAKSSSSKKDDDAKSSSSAKDDKEVSSSSEKAESSSSETTERPTYEDVDVSSSSEETPVSSSSSEEPESSSSEEVKPVEYANTTPNLADLEVSGDTLFAVFQRQNADYTISHNGLLAMYKLSDGTLLDTISLKTKNPAAVKIAGGNAYVATSGEYDASYNLPGDENRGIEKVDLKKKTSSLFVSGTKLGGGVSDFVVDKKNKKGYAAIYLAYGSVPVVEIDLSTGSIKEIAEIKDASGSLEFDEENGTLYISDRFMDWNTGDMHIGVFSYKNGTLTAVSDAEPDEEVRMPYSIKAIKGVPYVFMSDYQSGALYVDYADSESDGVDFYQDSKLAAVNGELYVMSRESASASIAKVSTADGSTIWQVVATGKNPYDMVAASSSTAWVAYYGTATLELISTANGSSEKLISTAEFCATK